MNTYASFSPLEKPSFLWLAFLLILSSPLLAQDNIVTRAYHDVTARDNAYFNANLKIQETEKKLFEGQKDNYEELLPVFKYGLEADASSVGPDMDDVIKRSSFPIQLHKNSKWVDDAYLLVGKAYFYKRDYEKALESFQYLISEYENIDKDRKKKSSKKKKKKKSSSKKKKAAAELPSQDQPLAFLKHHKKSPEASLWIVRTLIEMGRHGDATTAISVIRGSDGFPKKLEGELETIHTHLLLRQKKELNAIEHILPAIELTKSKKSRARLIFILAQLYSRQGRVQDAIAQYEAVLKLKPNYEMEFFTQISMANLLRDNKLKSGDEIKRMLAVLLKDEKNRDYFGLIYYAMADIDLELKRQEEGLKNLNLSVRNAGPDKRQLSLSYLRLADINYDEGNFRPAYYYYDSCLVTLDKQYERYSEAKDRRDGLSDLVEYLKTIDTEKQLQYWAGLPEKARVAEIEEYLLELKGPEEEEDDDVFFDRNQGASRGGGGPAVAGNGKWYFYDDARKGRGFSEFRKVWGKRALEDDWRRSDKRTVAPQIAAGEDGNEAAPGAGGVVDLEDERITLDGVLSSLPLDSASKLSSDNRLIESYYGSANIYKVYLKNNDKSVEYFKLLLKEYPDNKYRLETAYNLYLILKAPSNEMYKKIILEEFPESVFAQVILDPDYFAKLEKKDDEVKEYYATTFDLFEKEDYTDVLQRINQSRERFPENPIKAQFDLLAAMVVGETDSLDNFLTALQVVVNDHPGTPQAIRAQELLNHLRLGSVIQRAGEANLEESDYTLDPSSEHFVAVIMYETGREAAGMKTKVSDFNREFQSLANLRVSSLLFENDKTIILIKTFSNLDQAMRYFRDLRGNDTVFENLDETQYKLIAVSRNNYTNLYRKKDLDGYVDFFSRYYLTDN